MKRYALLVLAVIATIGFGALGVWQIERREWKLALIDRVERRIHAEPVAPPGPAEWSAVDRESAEYLRVTATGHFLPGKETLVNAVTALGGGSWVMAPFQTDAGFIVLVNRGFVSATSRKNVPAPAGIDEPVRITGLVRMTEPGGAFLRANAPGENRWYSRDVEAISQSLQLTAFAPYFIDAEAGPASPLPRPAGSATASGPPVDNVPVGDNVPMIGNVPVGGLTVVTFRNSHLMYTITWFSLALLTAGFGVLVARRR